MPPSVFSAISPKDWDEPAWNDAVAVLKKYMISRFILCPPHWKDYSNIALTWQKVQFNKAGISQLPDDKPGLYSFVVHPNVGGHEAIAFLLYIGETTKQTLRARCSDYLPESKKKKARARSAPLGY